MKLLHLFLLICIISNYALTSQRKNIIKIKQSQPSKAFFSPTIKELDYSNEKDVNEVCDLFKDKHIQDMLDGINQNDIKNILKHYTSNEIDKEASGKFITCTTNTCNSIICGVLIVSQNKIKKTAIYHNIVVNKNYRRRGVASSLMSHAEKNFISPSIQQINLVVLHNNKSAIKCYEKHGFHTPICSQINNYINTFIIGTKDNEITYKMIKNVK